MDDLQKRAELLAQSIKHVLLSSSGRTKELATTEERYFAFCTAIREEILANWTASIRTVEEKKVRVLSFLSMEYLPGRLTTHSLLNMGAKELIQATMKQLNWDLSKLMRVEPDPGLGNGGLGRLASCFLDSLASLHFPARAYGLRYQYGIFEQEILEGCQIERPDCWLLNLNPWEQRRDAFAVNVRFRGKTKPDTNKAGDEVFLLEDYEEVRALPFDVPIVGFGNGSPFSVVTLRLWSTKESPHNFQLQRYNAGVLDLATENTSLTDVLYPNDNHELGKKTRLKQEFLLVSASLQDILRRHLLLYGNVEELADKVRIQINDTHPVFVVAELIRILMKDHDFSWKKAKEACSAICSYTNHTILREALVEWNEAKVRELIPRQHQIVQRLNLEFCNEVRSRFPGDEEKVRRLSIIENNQIRMTHLAIFVSHKVNGVAKLHSQILKERVFKELYEIYPEKFTNVTNGVTHRRWLLHANPMLSAFITKYIGSEWILDFSHIAKLKSFASDRKVQEEFLAIKHENKKAMLRSFSHSVDPSSLFDVQIKRIHEYKRQLLNALFLMVQIQRIRTKKNLPKVTRLSLFAGKAAPGYERAKQIIQLLSAIGRTIEKDPLLSQWLRVVFVENYNVSKAEQIVVAADLSEQISTAGLEASGTGNMKLAMNGALTIGTNDGANIEMKESVTDRWWPFSFGASAKENEKPYNGLDIYLQNREIGQAVDSLRDGSFVSTPHEAASFENLYQSLVGPSDHADSFRVLQDLQSYMDAQAKVEELFTKPLEWAETVIHNIAAMGPFSTDQSIQQYAKIWGIHPCPIDRELLKKIKKEYAE